MDHSRIQLYASTQTISYIQTDKLLHDILTIFLNVIVLEVFPVDQIVHVMLIVGEGEFWDLGDLLVLLDKRDLRDLLGLFTNAPVFL